MTDFERLQVTPYPRGCLTVSGVGRRLFRRLGSHATSGLFAGWCLNVTTVGLLRSLERQRWRSFYTRPNPY
jgi:hypothetical protein